MLARRLVVAAASSSSRAAASSSSSGGAMKHAGPIGASMQRKLETNLAPLVLNIVNESHKHAGHAGNPGGGPDAETHFRVEVVSQAFEGKRLVQRHQLMYQLLDEEIKGGVHALSMETKTPQEAGIQGSAATQ